MNEIYNWLQIKTFRVRAARANASLSESINRRYSREERPQIGNRVSQSSMSASKMAKRAIIGARVVRATGNYFNDAY